MTREIFPGPLLSRVLRQRTFIHRWWSWLFIAATLLPGFVQTAQAAFPATQTNTTACTVAPCNGWYIVERDIGVFPTKKAACDAEFADYIAKAPRGTRYDSGEMINVGTPHEGCMVLGMQLGTYIGTIHHFTPSPYAAVKPVYSCPTGAALNGGLCTCTAPHVENAAGNACTIASTPPEAESCTAGSTPDAGQAAQSVVPSTGELVLAETDYAGAGADALSFLRSFRSNRIVGVTDATPAGTGAMWSHNHATSLKTYGAPGDTTRTAAILLGNGSVRAFAWDAASSGWKASSGSDTLASSANGATYKRADDDSVWQFDATGKLLTHTPRNGWTTRLQYNALSQLASVTNQFGRQLTFNYNPAGQLATMTAPGGDVTRYGYDGLGNLSTTTWPDGNVRRYHYEDGRFPRSLTGITDETGQRISSTSYDAQGRVTDTQRASGVERLQFAYSTDIAGRPKTRVTDFIAGAPTSRTHSSVRLNGMLRSAGVTAPCPTCGNTAQATLYDALGRKARALEHDGSVTFYAYNAKGQETERATFPASFSAATSRPALSNATSVTSTKWHPTWNLPVQIAEPDRITSYAYDTQGLIGHGSVDTTDATGAQQFNATPSSAVLATGYGYDASGLNSAIVEFVDSVETQRWTLAYNALGDLTSVTDVTKAQSATITQHTADGRVLQGSTDQGVAIAIAYNRRGAVTQITRGGQMARFTYNPVGTLTQVRTPDNQVIDYVLDARQAVVDIKLNGASVSAQMLALGEYPDSALKGQIEVTKQALIQSVEKLLRAAHAQVIIIGGGRSPTPPGFDPRTDMLMSPMSDADRAMRSLHEAIARACRCDPNQGFAKPKYTAVTFEHVFRGGHIIPMFSDQSYFASTEKVGQALVDEVIARRGTKRIDGTRDVLQRQHGTGSWNAV